MGPKLTQAEGFVLGVGAKIFQIAGPVIVYGVSASAVYGLIYRLLYPIINIRSQWKTVLKWKGDCYEETARLYLFGPLPVDITGMRSVVGRR